MYYTSMAIAILGLTVYQLVMKSAPAGVNPWWLLTAAYLIAAAVCLPAGFVWKYTFSPGEIAPNTTHLLPAALIALAVILIEIGYLLVYRAGWNISVAPGVAQAFTLSSLLVVGLIFFDEKITILKLAGIVLAVGGVLLLTYKPAANPG